MRSVLVYCSAGLCAAACAADIAPELSPRGTMPSRHVAHIYYNLATGERVATLLADGVRPADSGWSEEVWISDNSLPCAEFGQTGGVALVLDDPFGQYTSELLPTMVLDWGDIEPDTVIDCLGVNWSTLMQDTDTDSDGIGDGIEGFTGTWTIYDAENGFDSAATRQTAMEVTLVSLPGVVGTPDPNLMVTYTATIDLGGTTSSSGLVFEIGDTDSMDSSGTGNFNPGAGLDMDGDGLADFGYALWFTLPGTRDIDNADGDDDPWTGVDGDLAIADRVAWTVAVPNGDAIEDPDGVWTYAPDAPPAGQGAEDAIDWLHAPGVFSDLPVFSDTRWFGGFTCDEDNDGVGGDVRHFAQMSIKLYRDRVCSACQADLYPPTLFGACDGDGVLNFFDVSQYLAYFVTGNPLADIMLPNGPPDFFDMAAYISLYNQGCP